MPPQVLKQQVRALAANQDLQALRGGGLQPFGTKLPVLQAFQEFLELERRRARQRLLRTALGLLALTGAVLVGAALYIGRLSNRVDREVGQLERALAAAREEAVSLRSDTEAMRQSLADAQQALARLRKRFDSAAVFAGPAPDLSAISDALDALQLVQLARSDQLEAMALLDRIESDFNQLAADRQAERNLAARLLLERKELARAIQSFAARRREIDARIAEWQAGVNRAARSVAEPLQRGSARKRKAAEAAPEPAAPAPPDPALVAGLLEDIYRLRFEHSFLQARESALDREVAEWKSLRAGLTSREDALRRQLAALAERVAGVQERAQTVQLHLERLQAGPSAAQPAVN